MKHLLNKGWPMSQNFGKSELCWKRVGPNLNLKLLEIARKDGIFREKRYYRRNEERAVRTIMNLCIAWAVTDYLTCDVGLIRQKRLWKVINL